MKKYRFISIIFILFIFISLTLNGCARSSDNDEIRQLRERIAELEGENLEEASEDTKEIFRDSSNEKDNSHSEDIDEGVKDKNKIESEAQNDGITQKEIIEEAEPDIEEELIQQKSYSVLMGDASKFEILAYKYDLERLLLEPGNYSSMILSVVSGMYYDDHLPELFDYVRKVLLFS